MGDYLHLTRQHWIASLSLILPGNDDDSHLLPSTRQTTLAMFTAMCSRLGALDRLKYLSSSRNGSQDPSYLTVLDCTTVVLTLSGNDVFWVTAVSGVTLVDTVVAHQTLGLNPKMVMTF